MRLENLDDVCFVRSGQEKIRNALSEVKEWFEACFETECFHVQPQRALYTMSISVPHDS
jgi:hypothetical protein